MFCQFHVTLWSNSLPCLIYFVHAVLHCMAFLRGLYNHAFISLGRVAWNSVVRKIFHLPFRTHCRFLPRIANVENFAVTIRMRMLMFALSCLKSENSLVLSLSAHMYANNRSILGSNVHSILSECGINDVVRFPYGPINLTQLRSVLSAYFDISVDQEWRIGFIKDLLNNTNGIDSDVRHTLLEYLCCS